jgi:hypothetical protein
MAVCCLRSLQSSATRAHACAIFGTAEAPKWLSGAIRRLACKLPESDLRNWLMLVAADSVNMVEGIVEDRHHGHVPNVLAEMGIRSELRHYSAGLVRKTRIATAWSAASWPWATAAGVADPATAGQPMAPLSPCERGAFLQVSALLR